MFALCAFALICMPHTYVYYYRSGGSAQSKNKLPMFFLLIHWFRFSFFFLILFCLCFYSYWDQAALRWAVLTRLIFSTPQRSFDTSNPSIVRRNLLHSSVPNICVVIILQRRHPQARYCDSCWRHDFKCLLRFGKLETNDQADLASRRLFPG